MKETLDITDTVISFRLHRNDLQRYDIVVFTKPEDSEKLYIKRILGMPGETIVIRNGAVYADGLLLRSDFCPEIPNAEGDGIYPIPEGCYFLMGDNRNHSEDCRHWENGAIPADQIKAKALLVIWPLYDWRWLGNEG